VQATASASTRPAASEFSVEREWHSDRRSPARWLLSHIGRHKLLIAGILIGSLGNALGASVSPIFIGQAFNAINQPTPDYAGLLAAVGLIIASQLFRSTLQLARSFSAEIIGLRLERDVRDELYASLIGKSMSFHDRQTIGEVMARATNDVREVNLLMNPGINLVVGSAAFFIFPIIFSFRLNPALAIVPVAFVFLYAWSIYDYLRQLAPATDAVRRNFGVMNSALAEAIEGVEVVKATAQEQREINRFAQTVRGWRDAFVRQGDIEARFVALLLYGLATAIGLLQSLLMANAGIITIGDVIAYNGMLLIFQFPMFASQFAYSQVSSGYASARRILELINSETKVDQNAGGHDAVIRGEVMFDHVTFGYVEGKPALEDVTFAVQPGQTVALVGQTGSGKSTLTKLINRVYDATSGRVLVDGVDVRDWDLEALRRQISIIEQDIFLFSRTVAENIAFGKPDATHDEIEAAAKAAQAHEFILSFKDGYNTVVGERGVTLSGGQRQRIAIARAFLADPRILILDDSTSAIDSATEDQIQRAIARAAQGRTTFLITHRLSQIRWADVIVVMKHGRVDAVGSHDQLMQTSHAYRNIFAAEPRRALGNGHVDGVATGQEAARR
jgi:ATP-binding cassette subfamily B protein